MADNSDDPVIQNQDVIQGALGIRRNLAQLAALMATEVAFPVRRADVVGQAPQGAGSDRRRQAGEGRTASRHLTVWGR